MPNSKKNVKIYGALTDSMICTCQGHRPRAIKKNSNTAKLGIMKYVVWLTQVLR